MYDSSLIQTTRDYVAWTATTATYMETIENEEEKRYYPLLGLLDEIGEVAGLLKRQRRDGTEINYANLKLELGDIAWYLARIHYDHVGEVSLNKSTNTLFKVAESLGADKNSDWIRGTCFDDAFIIMELAKPHIVTKNAAVRFVTGRGDRPITNLIDLFQSMEVADQAMEKPVNKFIISMSERIAEDKTHIAGVLMHIVSEANGMEGLLTYFCLCYRLGFDIMDILRANVDKLESRKERGTLHGKGSHR
jgi:NTP pyrophosphatase (non-canonical NTP hydrolase)